MNMKDRIKIEDLTLYLLYKNKPTDVIYQVINSDHDNLLVLGIERIS